MTADANVERTFTPDTVALARLNGIVPTLAVVALAAALTDATYRATGEHTSLFYLSAAVFCTWAWGGWCGVLVVICGSLLTMHLPFDPPDRWYLGEWHAWARLALFSAIALGFVVLVHQLKARGRTLAQNVAKLETVLELAPVGIAIVDDPDVSQPANVNRTLAGMLGSDERRVAVEHDRPDFPFQSGGQPLPEEHMPMHEAVAMRRVSDRQEIDLVRGTHVTNLVAQAAPLVGPDGEPQGAVATYVDVTRERERERELLRANHAKDEFLGMVSHELNTPLTIIRGNVDVLARLWPEPDDEIRHALRDAQEASLEMTHDVENLLALGRVGDAVGALEPVVLSALLKRITGRHASSDQLINLRCEKTVVLAIPRAVEQVMDNLLRNAKKYSPPGSPIEVVVESDDGEVAVRVSDRGFGLLDSETEALFDPFYRSPRIAVVSQGMGLGLSASKRMVTAMGGRMWARNRESGGSEFGFTLLRAPTPDDHQATEI